MENKRSLEAEKKVSELSVFVEAKRTFNRLLDIRREKYAGTIYKGRSLNAPGGNRKSLKKDKLTEAMASIEQIDNKLLELSAALPGLYLKIRGIIDNDITNLNQKMILQLRYINGLTWPEISRKTEFEISYCRRLHREAIDILVKKETGKVNTEDTV